MTAKTRFRKNWRIARIAPRSASIITVSLVILFAMPVVYRTVFAGNTVGSFEIDGNLTVDHPSPPVEPIDWDSSPFPAALTTFSDETGPTDDIFGQGSKEDTQSTWSCVT